MPNYVQNKEIDDNWAPVLVVFLILKEARKSATSWLMLLVEESKTVHTELMETWTGAERCEDDPSLVCGISAWMPRRAAVKPVPWDCLVSAAMREGKI